ncbi:DgyrCDS6363 [Dimorphilus gyrociliatus]|uniref:DgyrCDS6363 n=1 Tax=Dimorphilus gyrociliatus TaxID=2664684 RepID=A0A7I8VMU6_9ANNE|nr:DgyrCDS6363 [Dimorphilus gyrociliatus]
MYIYTYISIVNHYFCPNDSNRTVILYNQEEKDRKVVIQTLSFDLLKGCSTFNTVHVILQSIPFIVKDTIDCGKNIVLKYSLKNSKRLPRSRELNSCPQELIEQVSKKPLRVSLVSKNRYVQRKVNNFKDTEEETSPIRPAINESLLLTALVINTLVLISLCLGFTCCATIHVLSNRNYEKREEELVNESTNATTAQIDFLVKALSQQQKHLLGKRQSEFEVGPRRSNKPKPKLTNSNKRDDTFCSFKDDVIFYQKSEKKENDRQDSQNQGLDYYDEVVQKIHYPVDSDIKANQHFIERDSNSKRDSIVNKKNLREQQKKWPRTKGLDAIWRQMKRTSFLK